MCQRREKKRRYNARYGHVRWYSGTCAQCTKSFVAGHKQKFCSHKCSSEARKKYLNIPDCVAGAHRKLDKILGYVRVYVPMHPEANTRGYVYEHRVIAEQIIGRRLKSNEVVHHKNRKRWDNRRRNLAVMTKKEHARLKKTG